jgi:predicted nucleotidyltransferase
MSGYNEDMARIDTVRKILIRHKHELRRKYRIKRLGIFGSFVRNEQKKNSDIDILVEFVEVPGLFKFLEIEDRLSRLLGTKADLVMKDTLKPYIGRHILNEVIYV